MNTVDECRATNLNDKNTAYKGNILIHKVTQLELFHPQLNKSMLKLICFCPDPPDKNVICCRARTAECLACSAGTSVSEYCSNHQNVVGCDGKYDNYCYF